ncbi:MAG TPA: hypothetical protein VMV69_05105 [Pirellulales bacterium]|nr:hypothetical protein [Pirellulales bacterium]
MASSENQGLQIALIIFVMLTIILSVTTFVFFRQADEATIRSSADSKKATEADKSLLDAVVELKRLKKWIGVPEDYKIDKVDETAAADFNKYVTALSEEKKNYHSALEYLYSTYLDKDDKLVAKTNQHMALEKEKEAFEAAKNLLVAEAQKKQQEAEDLLKKAQDDFTEERKKKNDQEQLLTDQLKAKEEALDSLKDSSKKEIEVVKSEKTKVEKILVAVNKKNSEIDPASGFEVPDGLILRVSQKAGSVWINVGQADGLRRQVTFSVVGADENVGKDQPTKGRIEVTEVISAHFAQCRILDDNITDPLVEGDKIFTPLWQPGRSESFGIVGKIDMNGDGEDDREMIVDLIHMAGGRVDAQVDPKTDKQEGNLNIHTRYLILGDQPDDAKLGDSSAYTKIQREADQLGVQIITVDKFLDHVGWKDQKQTLIFGGRKGNIADMQPTKLDGGSREARGNVSGVFKKRKPSRRGVKSTY